MKASLSVLAPKSDDDWASLDTMFSGKRDADPLIAAVLRRFRSVGCLSIVVEHAYIDRDFSAAFATFYSSLFKPLSKFCRRLHFFSSDVSGLLAQPESRDIVNALEAEKSNYLGDVILRPLLHAPVSSARISASALISAGTQEVSIKSNYRNHLLGVEFEVEAMPLAQQDTRTGACAQATMWMAGRHFYNRHSAPWFSMPDITEAALNPTDNLITRSLPAGSEYLTADNMVRALRAMGRHPVTYVPDAVVDGIPAWQNVRPKDVISRYVDSGIPVILGLQQAGTSIGHAVVAVGTERSEDIDLSALPSVPTTAEFMTHFLVNDDQRGAYCRLPIAKGDTSTDYPFSLEADIKFLLVPLPSKVFMTAETAELVARDMLQQVAHVRADLAKQSLGNETDWNEDPDFFNATLSGSVVARTYLTYGWRYKGRMLRNCGAENLRAELLGTQFPKYVWVTEFSTPEETKDLNPCNRLVRAHVVVDATGSRFWESRLIVDAPGLSLFWQYDPASARTEPTLVVRASQGATPYWPKMRGSEDYSSCDVPPA